MVPLGPRQQKGLEGSTEAGNSSESRTEQIKQSAGLPESRVQFEEIQACDLREDDGSPYRMDRIKMCGNGVVPAQVKEAFERLMGFDSAENK